MNPAAQLILQHLKSVDLLRAERSADASFGARVVALKRYQAARFARTYADLLQGSRYRHAARFFLDELYGPQEFGARDGQFARIVPALVRMFPDEIVQTVSTLAELHALSESLDSAMARYMTDEQLDAATYVRLWQSTGQAPQRRRQVALTIDVGRALDRYTRSVVLRTGLRMMRQPAQAAGLGELQRFLEAGFDTFGAMRGAGEFLETVEQRESLLAEALFSAGAITRVTAVSSCPPNAAEQALGQLP